MNQLSMLTQPGRLQKNDWFSVAVINNIDEC